jgi:sugar O-acyltransferase (sialic acid O-acetyltransferase NeuD family)
MKRLLILGAGGCGRETLQWAVDLNKTKKRWDEFAFLDYDETMLDGKKCPAKIIGNDDDYNIRPEDEFICAIGSGELRKKIIEKMEKRGAHFITLIHPTAQVADSAKIAEGAILYPYSIVTADVVIGKGCIINMHSSVTHDVRLGDYCTISPNCHIMGACEIGKNVFIGVGSSLIPGIRVGDNAYICAGSTVMTRVKADTRVIGNPAKRVKTWGGSL